MESWECADENVRKMDGCNICDKFGYVKMVENRYFSVSLWPITTQTKTI